MIMEIYLQISFSKHFKMALYLIMAAAIGVTSVTSSAEMALANVTRLATGDLFSLIGSDCGPTRCMEMSHGTALTSMGGGDNTCMCKCRRDTPAFREDQRVCVNHIDECLMAAFGRGETKPQIPFVFLPLKGQIIYPAKEIVFSDVEDAICAVTSAQYLSPSGWVTLRDLIDNDVPFGLYRDEGSTFLQWRGSAALHTRLEGRLVAAHVLCSASTSPRLAASCAAFRVAGASQNSLLDVRSIPFHAGEIANTEPVSQNQGLSVLESLAIGVCVLMLIFIYAAGIIFYIHYKQKQKRKNKDPEINSGTMSSDNRSSLESRIDMDNVMLKTNPLLKLNGLGSDFLHDNGLSDLGEHSEDTLDSPPNNMQKKLNSNVISAMVHTRRKKPSRPSLRSTISSDRLTERLQRRSTSPDTLERAPHSELSIVDCSMENNTYSGRQLTSSNGELVHRKKLYFNPVFFETEHLKNPPPAAIEFLMKIREVMGIAKEKMTSKRFVPILSDIPEEDLYHTIDLGWDIPCARRGRRFSAISLKQENSRKSVHCGGCPGCDSTVRPQKAIALTRSNSCKSCVSEDYKQRIVRKWLDEVPTLPASSKLIKSVAKVNGPPRTKEPKKKEDRPKSAELIRNDKNKPRITETILKEHLNEKCFKENMTKDATNEGLTNKPQKESKKQKDKKNIEVVKTKPIITVITQDIKNTCTIDVQDIKNVSPIEATKTPTAVTRQEKLLPNILMTGEKVNQITAIIPDKQSKSAVLKHEKKSPSSHTSRRIRKKLPPPPPPPVKPPEVSKRDEEPILPEVKVKMEAVLRELNYCKRVEPIELDEIKLESIIPIAAAPKIVIPVIAADSHYFSDDNMLSTTRRKEMYINNENFMEFDSLERSMLKRRRFSVACGPELVRKEEFIHDQHIQTREKLASSWREINKANEETPVAPQRFSQMENRRQSVSEVFIEPDDPLYDNLSKPGPLTIQVRGSPIERRRNIYEEFDPDTLDRKPRRDVHKRVEKILLKSAGSFKYKSNPNAVSANETIKKLPEVSLTKKIGSLRQIYEAKAKAQDEEIQRYNSRRGSIPYANQELLLRSLKTPDLIRHIEGQKEPKPPVAPKMRRGAELSPKFSSNSTKESPPDRRRVSEERDRFPPYTRSENLNSRRSGRRSARTRSRRTDLRKLYRTEDSGYMSTDSNESKYRARYLMQLKPKTALSAPPPMPAVRNIPKSPTLQTGVESDTDELESLCDGQSESGGESVETDSVFFGNFDESKEIFAELGLSSFEPKNKINHIHDQIDSGFVGETNIILSGDSDSEHRSVISIMTGRDSRGSAASFSKLEDAPYLHTIEC